MNRQKLILFVVGLALIGATAGVLTRLRASQKLGQPGVKTHTLAQSKNLEILLPDRVLEFTSELVEQDKMVLDALPKDTSFGQRRYEAADGFSTLVNVVLMGSDRTSLHKPQFCLEGSGWRIDHAASGVATVRVERPRPYGLPVMKLIATKQVTSNGQKVTARAVYLYWFVAEDALTARHWQRMWWMAKELLRTGMLQRWAYVTCFSVCQPGQEEATFNRMKQFLAEAVPEFQLMPSADADAEGVAPGHAVKTP
jgi:hypothetical protein